MSRKYYVGGERRRSFRMFFHSTHSPSPQHPFSWCCTAATQFAIEPEVPHAVVAVWELELTE